MIDQQFAANSTSVLLNLSGMLRWAEESADGGFDVEATHRDGVDYMGYHTHNGTVVWSVKERGGYPDAVEWAELEDAL
jgi:hypothetical protein